MTLGRRRRRALRRLGAQRRRVSVVGDFNGWDGAAHPMRPLGAERRVGGVRPRRARRGSATSSSSRPRSGGTALKSDPYGFAFESPPGSASIVCDPHYEWQDGAVDAPRAARRTRGSSRPMAAYEVHLGSWARMPEEGDRYLTYAELAAAPDSLRQGDGLHPHRAAAGDGASVLRIVGLPGHRLLRADQPLRHARAVQGVRRRVPPGRASASSSTGCPAISPRTRIALARFDGTALYEHQDPAAG